MASTEPGGTPRLPIKVILPDQGNERRIPGGGSPPRPFRQVTAEFRQSLLRQIASVESSFPAPSMASRGPVPLRVSLVSKAVAKSHRPNRLFSENSCPIIGAGRMGELFVKGTEAGLKTIREMIEHDDSPAAVKELSTIDGIEVVTPSYRRRNIKAVDILRKSPRTSQGFLARVRLFDFGSAEQPGVLRDFKNICANRMLVVSSQGYDPKSLVFSVECKSEEDIEALSRVDGVRRVGMMPQILVVNPKILNRQPLSVALPTRSVEDAPVVVVVDSGISEGVPSLASWVVGRKSAVAPQYRNEVHGTFVAGLICWGSELNPNLADIGEPCALFDLQLLPNTDASHGDIDSLTEQEFLQTLDSALQDYANRFKVWNMSLGTDEICSLDEFSPLAEELDNLQEKYQVSFVISAGNYQTAPLLDFPRTNDQLEKGRITSPADSVLGVTVGSISHIDYKRNGPNVECLSSFSRHGAGPNHIIKPDLVHYGGSCSTDLRHVAGVKSVAGGDSVEDLGTSFAAPLVSRTLAHIYHAIAPTPSPVLARALLTHHARDPRTGGRVPDGDENFFGFGRPVPPPYCIQCGPHESTLVFEDALRPGFFLEWDDFPYPSSLARDGRYYGEIRMTVAFAPVRGGRWGTEYCESHIEANFGVYYERVSRKTGEITEDFKGLVPPEHKNPGILYESYQVQQLRKWAPVRTYYGNLGERGERGSRWRLKLRVLTRHGADEAEDGARSQPFALIVTIADPEKRAPVYDEMARVIRTRFKAENLTVRSAARVRPRA